MPTFDPPSPDFGDVPATRRATCDVDVHNDETTAIDVALTGDGGGRFRLLNAPPRIAAGHRATVTVGFSSETIPAPAAVTGTLRAGTKTVTLSATVQSPIKIEETTVACGDALIDAGVVSVVRVTNSHISADATLTLKGAAAFEAVPTDVSPSGVTQAVWIRFRPTDEGPASATLTATAGAFAATCAVTGNGVREALEDVGGEEPEPEQRFHIDVPKPHTYLGLGAKIGGTLEGKNLMALSMNGVGLETEEDIFVNGMGGESRLFAQATKNVVLQSVDESLFTSAKENNVQCAGEMSYVLGSKGVVIAAGLPLNYTSLSALDGTHDTTAPHAWAAGFAGTDAAVGVMLAALDTYHLTHEWKHIGKWAGAFAVGGRVATLTGAAMSAAGAADVIPAATVLGLAGVVVATPAFLAMYGLAGIGLVSTYPTIVGILDAAMLANREVTISALGGAAALQGRVVEIRGRREISLKATTHKGHKHAPISLAGSQIELKAYKEAISEHAAHAGEVEVDAAKEVTIGVGKFLVKISEHEILIGVRPNEKSHSFAAHKSRIALDETGVLLYSTGAKDVAGKLDLNSQHASLQSGNKTRLTLSSSGAKLTSPGMDLKSDGPLRLKGGMIKLG